MILAKDAGPLHRSLNFIQKQNIRLIGLLHGDDLGKSKAPQVLQLNIAICIGLVQILRAQATTEYIQ